MSLKIYRWEKQQFPWQDHVNIKPEYRIRLAAALAKHWKLGWVEVRMTTRGGGWARNGTFNSSIRLPTESHPCSLLLIVHELAHVYDYLHFKGNGHRASFKRSLIKLQVEVRALHLLPPIFAQIRQDVAQWATKMARVAAMSERAVARTLEASLKRQRPDQKLMRVGARIKRLETKARRINTALRKARRSLAALERYHGSSKKHVEAAPLLQERPSIMPGSGHVAG